MLTILDSSANYTPKVRERDCAARKLPAVPADLGKGYTFSALRRNKGYALRLGVAQILFSRDGRPEDFRAPSGKAACKKVNAGPRLPLQVLTRPAIKTRLS